MEKKSSYHIICLKHEKSQSKTEFYPRLPNKQQSA